MNSGNASPGEPLPPLEGIKVLDLTQLVSGPFCTMMLGDMGADVTKVEPPKGEMLRALSRVFQNGENVYFLSLNRNKKSIAIDLTKKEGQNIVHELAESSDVFVENYRPGVVDKLGVGYEVISEINPRIVYCSISSYGQQGPWKDLPGADTVVQGLGGFMSVTGEPDGPPMRAGPPVTDIFGANFAFQGILLALLVRERTGQGQKIEISLLDSIIAAQTNLITMSFATEENPPRLGNASVAVAPGELFKTKDGYLNITIYGEKWCDFCNAIEIPELEQDPRFDSNIKRMEKRDTLHKILEEVLIKKTGQEWLEIFKEFDIMCAPVLDYKKLLSEPQLKINQMVVEIDHPTAGKYRTTGIPIKLKDTPGRIVLPSPTIGQHTDEILKEIDYTEETISRLRGLKVIN